MQYRRKISIGPGFLYAYGKLKSIVSEGKYELYGTVLNDRNHAHYTPASSVHPGVLFFFFLTPRGFERSRFFPPNCHALF